MTATGCTETDHTGSIARRTILRFLDFMDEGLKGSRWHPFVFSGGHFDSYRVRHAYGELAFIAPT